METRVFLSRGLELRAAGGKPVIVGTPVVYNQRSELIQGMFYEYIRPGAFKTSIGGDIRALVEHNPAFILGRTTAGTVRLKDAEDAMTAEIDPPDTSYGKDTVVSISNGSIRGMSFGFDNAQCTWGEEGGVPTRWVESANLLEVTITAFPYYQQTELAVRAYNEWNTTRAIIASAFKANARRRLDLVGRL